MHNVLSSVFTALKTLLLSVAMLVAVRLVFPSHHTKAVCSHRLSGKLSIGNCSPISVSGGDINLGGVLDGIL